MLFKFITPFPSFPQGGRRKQTFPPLGKMKGGKRSKERLEFYRNYEVSTELKKKIEE